MRSRRKVARLLRAVYPRRDSEGDVEDVGEDDGVDRVRILLYGTVVGQEDTEVEVSYQNYHSVHAGNRTVMHRNGPSSIVSGEPSHSVSLDDQ